jgi:aryl-alcohol dehydrogenase-like predicted oxidoreductase
MKGGAKVLELAYNLFFSGDLQSLSADLAAQPTAILARSVLAYGLLAGMLEPGHVFAPDDHRRSRWSSDELRTRLRQLDAVRPLVSGEVLSLRAAALRFVLSSQLVSAAVLGPRSVPQLEQLVREAGSGPPYLPDDALARLPGQLARTGVDL